MAQATPPVPYTPSLDPLEPEIERRGALALAPPTAIAKIASIADLAAVVADSHRTMVVLGPMLFSLRAEQDAKDATETIAGIDQPGLGLPDRDYYLKTDERSLTLRTKSAAHVARVFQLLGDTPAIAAANAQTVLRVETGLANGQMSRVERRNPDSTYHRLPLATLKEMTPSWPWDAYFKQMGVAQIADLNIAAPGYFSALERQLASVPLNDWQAYLRWHTARLASPYLSAACVDADFAFFSRTLAGAQQLPPRLADLDELARDLEGHRVLRIAEEVAGANPDRRIVAPSFHGVDDSGRLFDAKGNRRDWWTRPADGQGTGLPGLVAGL